MSKKTGTTTPRETDPPAEPGVPEAVTDQAKLLALKNVGTSGRRLIEVLSYKMTGEAGQSYFVGREDICVDLPGVRDPHFPDIVHQCAKTTVRYGDWREAVETLRNAIRNAEAIGLSSQQLTDLNAFWLALIIHHNNCEWLWPERTKTPLDECRRVEVDIEVPLQIEQARKAVEAMGRQIEREEKEAGPAAKPEARGEALDSTPRLRRTPGRPPLVTSRRDKDIFAVWDSGAYLRYEDCADALNRDRSFRPHVTGQEAAIVIHRFRGRARRANRAIDAE